MTTAPPPQPGQHLAAGHDRSARPVRHAAALAVLALCAVGTFAYLFMDANGFGRPRGNNIFFVLYVGHELPFIAATALFALVVLGVRPRAESDPAPAARGPSPRVAAGVAFGVTLLGWLGTSLLAHRYALSMDEYSAQFQARIFASGHVVATLPQAYRGVAEGLTPIFTTYLPAPGAWTSMYLPVYAALRALFLMAGVEWLVNPVLSGASVLLLAALARRIWPTDGARQWLALLLLVTSSQFLLTTATAYSMPAHLCLNLLWLWLWLRDDRVAHAALPLLGVLALGLHNPFPHALFVAPFLLLLVVRRRWRLVAWYGVVYGAGALGWLVWLKHVQPFAQQGGTGGLLALFRLPSSFALIVQGMNLTLLATWQTPLVMLGVAAALFRFRSLAHPLRELAYGAILTYAFYFLFPSDQGHGWGYRYLFPVMGGIMLLAAEGWTQLAETLSPRIARGLLAAGIVVALAQLPVRAVEMEGTVRPFAEASAYLHSRPADVVMVPVTAWWYGQDFIRNDPRFAEAPVLMAIERVSEPDYRAMRAQLGGDRLRVRAVTFPVLARFGVPAPFATTAGH